MLATKLAPGILERAVGRFAPRLQFDPDAADVSDGSLFASSGEHAQRGGWREYWRNKLFGER
jgi:hypothetical protein